MLEKARAAADKGEAVMGNAFAAVIDNDMKGMLSKADLQVLASVSEDAKTDGTQSDTAATETPPGTGEQEENMSDSELEALMIKFQDGLPKNAP